MSLNVIIWDNDGTVSGSKNPNDSTSIILPNIHKVMNTSNIINVLCSGCKTLESEQQNFNPKKVIYKFKNLMRLLPIEFAVFSPAIGGVECYILLKENDKGKCSVKKIHNNDKYKNLIGQFKKPGIGMLEVIKDIIKSKFNYELKDKVIMIGDSWHDKVAVARMQISFLNAKYIHKMHKNMNVDSFLNI